MKYGQPTKINAPITTTIPELLFGIRNGSFYATAYDVFRENGYEHTAVGFSVTNAIGVDTDIRYAIQTVKIPLNQRGNLVQFAGLTVDVICTSIARGSAAMGMWIKVSAQ